ncbi:MAG: hypothetical protein IJK31_01260 [Ruminococcus sp.]|nr:hypothetical protein [Ruminococcus sp.]
MTKEDILRKARTETMESKMDELEKHTFDRSFYWAFLSALTATVLFSWARMARGEEIYDVVTIVSFSAAVTSFYRFIRSRRISNLMIALLNLFITILFTYRFITEK